MELALICVRQVAALFVMIFAGFVCVRTGVVAMDAKKAFSDLLLGLVAPCMILNSYMAEFDWRTLQNLLLAGGLAVLLQGTAILAARLARPLFHGSEAPILRFGCIYYNAGLSAGGGAVRAGGPAVRQRLPDGVQPAAVEPRLHAAGPG